MSEDQPLEVDDNPDNAAACLVSYLEARVGIFTIDADGYLHADLDAVPHFGNIEPATLIGVVLHLAPEIKRILRARHGALMEVLCDRHGGCGAAPRIPMFSVEGFLLCLG